MSLSSEALNTIGPEMFEESPDERSAPWDYTEVPGMCRECLTGEAVVQGLCEYCADHLGLDWRK